MGLLLFPVQELLLRHGKNVTWGLTRFPSKAIVYVSDTMTCPTDALDPVPARRMAGLVFPLPRIPSLCMRIGSE